MPTRDTDEPTGVLPLPAVLRSPVLEARRQLDNYVSAVVAALTEVEGLTNSDQARGVWLEAVANLGANSERLREALNRVSAAVGLPRGGKGRLLALFQLRIGERLTGKELGAVAGIGEWARRVRELRAEGYRIGSDETEAGLGPGEYVLLSRSPDTRVRDQWQRAAEIRRLRISPRERLALYLHDNPLAKLTEEQLRHATRARNIRDLIHDAQRGGWHIQAHEDASDLARGEYRLVDVSEV